MENRKLIKKNRFGDHFCNFNCIEEKILEFVWQEFKAEMAGLAKRNCEHVPPDRKKKKKK